MLAVGELGIIVLSETYTEIYVNTLIYRCIHYNPYIGTLIYSKYTLIYRDTDNARTFPTVRYGLKYFLHLLPMDKADHNEKRDVKRDATRGAFTLMNHLGVFIVG